MKTALPEMKWPALIGPQAAPLLAMQYQFEKTQWYSADDLLLEQLIQVSSVLEYANKTIPYYQNRFKKAGVKIGSNLNQSDLLEIPVLTRKDVQEAGKALASRHIPKSHGKTGEISTSGSTGQTVKLLGTNVTNFYWQVLTLREHLWHKRDFLGKLAIIRKLEDKKGLPPNGEKRNGWGPATDVVFKMGPSVALNISATVSQQIEWLRKENPDYLLTYPSNLLALAKQCQSLGLVFTNLRELRTLGEVVSTELRDKCEKVFGVPLVDIYSCQEAGYLALQCPEQQNYHIQSENVYLEILDENDRPCEIGQVGRVVITTLNNFATPLIRYDIGDYAELGGPCACGRGLPVLKHIKGRVRNMLKLPSDEQRWPTMGTDEFGEIAPIEQFQFVQKTVDVIEVKIVAKRPLTETEEAQLTKKIQTKLGYPFELKYNYLSEIPKSKSGKYEDFISEL